MHDLIDGAGAADADLGRDKEYSVFEALAEGTGGGPLRAHVDVMGKRIWAAETEKGVVAKNLPSGLKGIGHCKTDPATVNGFQIEFSVTRKIFSVGPLSFDSPIDVSC